MAELRHLLADAAAHLGDRLEAELLLCHAIGKPRAWLFAHADDDLGMDVQTSFSELVRRREAGEPVAYLTGRRGFWTLDLEVTPATLIPRPETELLVELALARLPPDAPCTVADLGTGSGAIALAIARECPHADVIATDASPDALVVAQRNAQRLGLANLSFREGDWLSPLAGKRVDLIVSNPPYIEAGDPHLDQGDLRFEPHAALTSGADGLDAIRRIVAPARDHLTPGGWLLFEHGWRQGEAARGLLHGAGYAQLETFRDLEHRDRVSGGRRPV